MANKIIIKNGAGAPANDVLDIAELGFDTQNKRLYIGDSESTNLLLNPPEVTIDFNNANQGTASGLNADTLGGLAASEYATKEFLIAEYATLEDISELQNNAVTEEQVSNMINSALEVIENGTY